MNDILTIPMQISDSEYILLIAIPPKGIKRIMEYDPAEIPIHKMGEPFSKLNLKEIHITHYNEEDDRKIKQMISDHTDPKKIVKMLVRGWKYRPDHGDNDLPPTNLKPLN